MPEKTSVQRILVKAQPGLDGANFALGGSSITFEAEPLFQSIGQSGALGAAPSRTWYVLKPSIALDQPNIWDLCHSLVQNGFGVAVGTPEFAEPDLQQRWIVGDDAGLSMAVARMCEEANKPNPLYPTEPDPLWFRDADHSRFDAAGNLAGVTRVRVAHFDTDYDPAHHALPRYLNKALGHNFVDDDRPNDASDDTTGPFNNLGHGTGTLGILAGYSPDGGKPIGSAPDVEVVPIRVANRVVLFYNSTIAKAFDYVHG